MNLMEHKIARSQNKSLPSEEILSLRAYCHCVCIHLLIYSGLSHRIKNGYRNKLESK